ncbi:MAG: acyl-CoA dehydratase activase-related protein [Anaerolineae bacterium]|nr:acyl-CoA dehydratase activase-related protein [Anaerolineae bacterium]
MRIGVPRALSFYRFHPAWAAFFEQLGIELVVSPPTNRTTLEAGLPYAVAETCLPMKLFYGHTRMLVGQVDYLLAPSIQRLTPSSSNCARLIGLPDLLRATMPDLPPLIAPNIDLSQGIRALIPLVLEMGAPFTRNPLTLRDAVAAAWSAYRSTRQAMMEGRLTPADFGYPIGRAFPALTDGIPVGVVGHPYNLYDSFINHQLLTRLARLGVKALTPERLAPQPANDYWAFEYELVGAARLALKRGAKGLIAVVAFGCGPDAVLLEEVQRLSDEAGIPLMKLVLDEHSGEAGLVTRLEAFVDMLRWREAR